MDAVVLLRVLDARLRGQDLQRALGRGRVGLRELRVLATETLRGGRAGGGERAILLGVRGVGLEADDQLARDSVILRRTALRSTVGLATCVRAGDGREQERGQTDDERPDRNPWRTHASLPL